MMKLYSVFAVLLLVFISSIQAQMNNTDDCLDPAAGRYLVNQALNAASFPDPDTDSISSVIATLYNILRADSSAYALNLYLGYDSGHFISVQNCRTPAQACFDSPSGYFATVVGYGDYIQRYYPIASNGSVNPNSPLPYTGAAYNVTGRPWYNANGWSAPYVFVNANGATGRSYEQTQSNTGAHVASDRLSTEPCTGNYANSPAILAAQFLASANDIAVFGQRNATTLSQIGAFLNSLQALLVDFQTASNGLSSVGVGYASSYYYAVTDCAGLPSQGSGVAACSGSGYFGEVRNEIAFNNADLQVYNFATGQFTNSGTFFDTTARPWYVIQNGWTDPYAYQGAGAQNINSRTYAASFNGGVAYADPNPSFPRDACPTATATPTVVPSMVPSYSYSPSYSPPPSCQTATPSPSGCVASPSPSPCGNGNGNNNDDSVTINFYFADILRQN